MFRVLQHPSSGVLKTVTAASGTGHNIGTATSLQRGQSGHVVGKYLYRGLRLQFLVLLMMGAVTPETCRVTLQWNKSDCILLHLVGLLFNVNFDAWNHELKKKKRDMSIDLHVKYPLFLSDINETWIFSKVFRISNFMEIRPVAAELFYADRQPDMTKLMVTFRNFANAPKNAIRRHCVITGISQSRWEV